VAEDGWLEDPDRRRDFFENVLRHHRRRTLARRGLDPQELTELHTAHQLLLERLMVKG
jgi:hypothetical protein